MKCSRRLLRKHSLGFIFLIIILIFYLEFFSYYLNSQKWHIPKCNNRNECTNILLVADPQIIGKYKEIYHFLTPLSTLDSDRYLKNTYKFAYSFVKPDIVIFLGDLMDEGSSATNEEFYSYVRRIFNIFLLDNSEHVKHIWLPGDNDIGGEGVDRITSKKISRFQRAFFQPDLISIKNITFFKVNRLIQSIPVFKGKREFYDTTHIFVGLSHLPLMFMPSLFVDKVFSKMLPQLLFTAHEHKSMIISTDGLLRQDRHIIPVTQDNNAVFEFTLGATNMYEIIVPTCSYRMGTDTIGYGFAVLEKNKLRYTVLWSPSRFQQLYIYLIIVICIILFCIYFKCCSKFVSC